MSPFQFYEVLTLEAANLCWAYMYVCRCVLTDGFRKVMHMDAGVVKQERDGPVEFQHPYFKHGQDDLLENIKRKVVIDSGARIIKGVNNQRECLYEKPLAAFSLSWQR